MKGEQKRYQVYIIKCNDDTLYCGITTDIERRLAEHNSEDPTGKGAQYTKSRRPVILVYSAEYPNRSTASREESRIKSLTRKQKIALCDMVIQSPLL